MLLHGAFDRSVEGRVSLTGEVPTTHKKGGVSPPSIAASLKCFDMSIVKLSCPSAITKCSTFVLVDVTVDFVISG